jgi:uncharacterized membrane protein
MTLLSCLAIGFAFAVAVALLVFAGVAIGWLLPRRIRFRRLRNVRRPGSR